MKTVAIKDLNVLEARNTLIVKEGWINLVNIRYAEHWVKGSKKITIGYENLVDICDGSQGLKVEDWKIKSVSYGKFVINRSGNLSFEFTGDEN